jgi:hypothetical protein
LRRPLKACSCTEARPQEARLIFCRFSRRPETKVWLWRLVMLLPDKFRTCEGGGTHR